MKDRRSDIDRYRENLKGEVEDAALYHLMAGAEETPELAEVYRRLASEEELDELALIYQAKGIPAKRARELAASLLAEPRV